MSSRRQGAWGVPRHMNRRVKVRKRRSVEGTRQGYERRRRKRKRSR